MRTVLDPPEETLAMALQGNIDSFSIVDVLRLLASSSKSGRLVVDGDRGSGSLWLVAGELSAATTTRLGAEPVAALPGEVLFDLLRFAEGSFVFEADVDGPLTSLPSATVEDAIAEAQSALDEWAGVVAVVPSLRARVGLALDLAGDSVVLDRRAWSGIVALAAAGERSGGGTTAGEMAELAGLSELPALRLVRDLVGLGVAEVGPEVDATARFEPAFEHQPFEPAPLDPFDAPFGAPVEPAPAWHPAADAVADEPPAYAPADVHVPDVPAPIGEVPVPPTFDAFEPFDPFGTAAEPTAAAVDETVAAPGPVFEPVEHDVPDVPDVPAPIATDAVADPAADVAAESAPSAPVADVAAPPAESDEDSAAREAEFARQLAMLSPRAAEAVAIAEAGPQSEDEERARVARFLGSV